MAIARTLQNFLSAHHAPFEVMTHPHSGCSVDTAALADVPGDRLAKSVMLRDERGYVMAVVPSSRQVRLRALNRQLGRHLRLAEEREFGRLFQDCEIGAIPPMGPAYGIPTVMDVALMDERDVYFEAGDHEELIHMEMDTFLDLMAEADRARITRAN